MNACSLASISPKAFSPVPPPDNGTPCPTIQDNQPRSNPHSSPGTRYSPGQWLSRNPPPESEAFGEVAERREVGGGRCPATWRTLRLVNNRSHSTPDRCLTGSQFGASQICKENEVRRPTNMVNPPVAEQPLPLNARSLPNRLAVWRQPNLQGERSSPPHQHGEPSGC